MRSGWQTRGRRRLAVAWLGSVLAAATLVATTVNASMFDSGTFEGSDAFTWDDCGFPVDATTEITGRFHNRTGTGPDAGAFFAHTSFEAVEVHVPRDGGRTIVIETKAVYQETRGTRLDGDVFLFEARVPGTTTFRLIDGTVLLRDAGVVKQVYTIDTLGDDTPGGVDFQLLSYTWAGPHPSVVTDLCTLF